MELTRADIDRFWMLIDKDGPVPSHVPHLGQCWTCTTATVSNPYGRFSADGQTQAAHRVSWLIHHGQPTEGSWVLHRCDNPPCVNPAHLFLGTAKDNAVDAAKKDRAGRPKIAASDKRTIPIKTMVTSAEGDELRAVAERQSRTVSDWARLALLEIARR